MFFVNLTIRADRPPHTNILPPTLHTQQVHEDYLQAIEEKAAQKAEKLALDEEKNRDNGGYGGYMDDIMLPPRDDNDMLGMPHGGYGGEEEEEEEEEEDEVFMDKMGNSITREEHEAALAAAEAAAAVSVLTFGNTTKSSP